MKQLFLFFATIAFLPIYANEVKFSISDGPVDGDIKTKIETNVSKILTETNAAHHKGRRLNFSAMEVNERVQQSMSMLWDAVPFICTDDEIIEHCIITDSGYQVRNIPLLMKPLKKRDTNEGEYHEAVICFDKEGNVDKFYLAVPMDVYTEVIRRDMDSLSYRCRLLILDFIEQYCTAYIQKDIEFISNVFSDNLMVYNGQIVTNKEEKVSLGKDIEQNKEQFVKSLRMALKKEKRVNLQIDDIVVQRSHKNPYFYGVSILQKWTSGNYHDSGYLFLLWQFNKESAPLILFRAWQPNMINGEPLPEGKIMNLSDFDIKPGRP